MSAAAMKRRLLLVSGGASARLECIARHVSNTSSLEIEQKPSTTLVQPKALHPQGLKALAQGSPFPPLTPGVLRIYNMRFCPFAQRTKLVLEHLKIPHETINVNLKFKPDWFLELSPLGLVPVLQLDNMVLPESTATCDWLDDNFGGEARLTPQDTFRRAWDRVLFENMSRISDIFYALRRNPEMKEKKIAGVVSRLQWYEDILAKRASVFFGGDTPAMVDFLLWPHFERLPALSILASDPRLTPDHNSLPSMATWMDAMRSLPAVKATIMDHDSHAHFFASFSTGTPAYDFGLV